MIDLQSSELICYRNTQQLITDINHNLLIQIDNILQQFNVDYNTLYRNITDSINECLIDWQRNSDTTNIPRLLSLLQSLLPDINKYVKQINNITNSSDNNNLSLVELYDIKSKEILQSYHNDVEKLMNKIKKQNNNV